MILVRAQAKSIYFPVSGVPASVGLGKGGSSGGLLLGLTTDFGGFNTAMGLIRCDLNGSDTDTIGPLDVIAMDVAGNVVGDWHGVVLDALPSTGDPLAASVPGSYTGGQAGFLIGQALANPGGVLPASANTAIAVEVLDKANAVETGLTIRQAIRLVTAALTGKLAIVGSTVTIKGAGVNTDRVSATTDAFGQRTAVNLTP